jgi:hypothetical protein
VYNVSLFNSTGIITGKGFGSLFEIVSFSVLSFVSYTFSLLLYGLVEQEAMAKGIKNVSH